MTTINLQKILVCIQSIHLFDNITLPLLQRDVPEGLSGACQAAISWEASNKEPENTAE